tara:strand:+ start:3601 stop:3963 length:363 start_codon:yes stop_codon:yes gene_type:complete
MNFLPDKLNPKFKTKSKDKEKALNKAIEENSAEINALMPRFLRLASEGIKANIAHLMKRGLEAEFVGDTIEAAKCKKEIKEQHRIHQLLHLALELHDNESARSIGRAMAIKLKRSKADAG